uniref:Uncharacterized protein n=1 Tax=Arundo donax TaxID=35708 RepID=A0A0A9EJA6_ARUDO
MRVSDSANFSGTRQITLGI